MVHYYSENQVSEFSPVKIKAVLRGKDLEFYTAGGVFSIKKIDKGTELLINNCIILDNWEVLDLGCGYGPIGISIAKTTNAKVIMTDINKRALRLTKMNLKLNDVEVELKQGDLYKPLNGKMFDTILTNPPYTAGRKICFQIIEESKEHLKKKGILQLVAKHRKGGDMLSKKMKEVFGNVKVIVKGSGYRIYVSEFKD